MAYVCVASATHARISRGKKVPSNAISAVALVAVTPVTSPVGRPRRDEKPQLLYEPTKLSGGDCGAVQRGSGRCEFA
jgi:hypothetical protein